VTIITIKTSPIAEAPLFDPRPLFPSGWTNPTLAGMAIAMDPAVAFERDRLRQALLLADQVYHRCPMVPTRSGVNWMDFNGEYAACVRDRVYGHECQGRATLFLMALKAFGLKGRSISLYSAITNVDASTFVHAATEVQIAGQWIGVDPHYNRTLRDGEGNRIGYRQAQLIIAAGGSVSLQYEPGFVGIPNLTPEHYLNNVYHMTFADLLRYIVVGVHAGSSSAIPYATNGAWSGILNYTASGPFNALAMVQQPHYYALI
jgi:hypothetical protein